MVMCVICTGDYSHLLRAAVGSASGTKYLKYKTRSFFQFRRCRTSSVATATNKNRRLDLEKNLLRFIHHLFNA